MRNKVVFDELKKLRQNQEQLLRVLSKNISSLIEEIRRTKKVQRFNFNEEFANLPQHLQRTVIALKKIGKSGTATQVSLITLRARANESLNLNRLVELDWVSKKRERQNSIGQPIIIFSLEKKI